jgi:serine/threonine-protein kinase HipA
MVNSKTLLADLKKLHRTLAADIREHNADSGSLEAVRSEWREAFEARRTARWDGFTKDELAHLAARAGLPERLVLGAARETVEAFREMWGTERGHLPPRDEIAEVIDRQLGIVPLVGSG